MLPASLNFHTRQSRATPDLFNDWFDPIEDMIRGQVRGLIEEMIRGELDATLSRPRYGPGIGKVGIRQRLLRADGQKVLLVAPRSRFFPNMPVSVRTRLPCRWPVTNAAKFGGTAAAFVSTAPAETGAANR
jgi:hypothetical protein